MTIFNSGWTAEQWAALGSVVQAVATVLALVVAVVAARYAAGQVRQARGQVDEARKAREAQEEQARQQSEEQAQRDQRLREEQARPFVVVDFEPSPVWGNIINLVVENIGSTLAKNVRLSFDPPLKSSQAKDGRRDLGQSVLLTQGVAAMPPGRRIVTLFDLTHERITTDLPTTYRVRVDLHDFQGRDQEPLEYVLDLSFRYDLEQLEEKTVHHMAQSLKEIQKDVHRWTQHFNGLRVWVRDEDEYLAREKEDFARRMAGRDEPDPGSVAPEPPSGDG